jgi:membrane carboxypeptidase/penicillin-binding protein
LRTLIAIFLVVLTGLAVWFFVYTGDLPDIGQLTQFAPAEQAVASDACLSSASTVVPSDRIDSTFFSALATAEQNHSFDLQIARLMMCGRQYRPVPYQLATIRLGWHIRRKFTEKQIATIYANRAYFGVGVTGVQNASVKLFGKGADHLSIEEAALLAGMLAAPDRFSPYAHPEKALERRNKVLADMATEGKISAAEAARAEIAPIVAR